MSLLASRADIAEFRRRPRWLAIVVILTFLALTIRLFVLQVVKADEYRALARENVIRRTPLATTRGVIRDRFGRVLAASRPSYNVYCVPSKLDMQEVWPRLVKFMNLNTEERQKIEERLHRLRNGSRKDWQ
ncbi:MAG: penicillin-binding protein 2, partial [Polyangiaceae bacterium]|nr:penicillin-binding protein 2 [Polyangiaceae bacterium]